MSDLVSRFVRVFSSGIYGLLAMLLMRWLGIQFSEADSALIIGGMVVVFGAVANVLIGMLSKKLPFLENLLIIGTQPTYKKVTG